jgi:hypothetical protein
MTVEDMTIERVKQYVHDEGITSVEEFMQCLPPEVLQTFTLVENSRSRQRPSNAIHPRIIMFLPDGRFFLTIATNPRSRAYNDVEMMEFTEEKDWKLDLIPFDANNTFDPNIDYVARLPANVRCVACHGKNSRPIWGSYNDWPGVFADNAGQRLTERQARKLTYALSRSGGAYLRLTLLDWNSQLAWTGGDKFSIPLYNDVPSPDLPNDALMARHSEHLWKRIQDAKDKERLLIAYLFLDKSGFMEDLDDDATEQDVLDVKVRLRAFVDDKFRRNEIEYYGTSHSDKALLLLNLDTYDDLFVKRGMHDLNHDSDFDPGSDWEPHEIDIDRNFSPGGDEYFAFLHLQILNDLIEIHPELEAHLENTTFDYSDDYPTVNVYRLKLSRWLWQTSVEERITHLKRTRHLAGQMRFSHLFPKALQKLMAADLLRIAEDTLNKNTLNKKQSTRKCR